MIGLRRQYIWVGGRREETRSDESSKFNGLSKQYVSQMDTEACHHTLGVQLFQACRTRLKILIDHHVSEPSALY